MDKKIQYLYSSLADLQSTIRAIDTKVSYLLVLLFLPATKLGAIYSHLKPLLETETKVLYTASLILTIIFCGTWGLGFWFALRTIIAIDDPKQHIDGERPESMFYPAHLFSHSIWSSLGFSKSKSSTQFAKHFEMIPDDPEEVSKHLTLEQMKAMYIASVKIKRSIDAYRSTILWVIAGGTLWFINLLFV